MAVSAWQARIAKRNQAELMRTIVTKDQELRNALLTAVNSTQAAINKIPGTTFSSEIRRTMYMSQRGNIADSVQTLWSDDIDNIVRNGLREATTQAVEANKSMLKFMLGAAKTKDADLARSLWASQINSWRNVQSRILNKIDLSTNVYNNEVLMAGKIDEIVNNGLALGKSAKEIADDAEQYINPDVMGGTRYAAMRLSRTEMNNAYRQTAASTYAASPFVEGVAWVVSGSHPDDDDCDALADSDDFGLGPGVYPPDEVPDAPHPNCFCDLVPLTPSPEEFVNNMLDGQYDDSLGNDGLAQSAVCH